MSVHPVSRWFWSGISIMAVAVSYMTVGNVRGEEPVKQEPQKQTKEQEVDLPGIPWSDSPEDINKQALASGKPILVDFYAVWCGFCKKQDATSYQDDRVILLADEVVPGKIDGDQNRELAQAYQVEGFPTVVLLDKDGNVLQRAAGASEPDDYVRWLASGLWEYSGPKMLERAKANPNDLVLTTKLALLQSTLKQEDEGQELFAKAAVLAANATPAPQDTNEKAQRLRSYRVLLNHFLPLQDHEKCVPLLQRIIEGTPYPLEVLLARFYLAESYYQTGQTAKAVTELETILKVGGLPEEQKKVVQEKLTAYKKQLAN